MTDPNGKTDDVAPLTPGVFAEAVAENARLRTALEAERVRSRTMAALLQRDSLSGSGLRPLADVTRRAAVAEQTVQNVFALLAAAAPGIVLFACPNCGAVSGGPPGEPGARSGWRLCAGCLAGTVDPWQNP
jgi:hypothetical protein